MINNSKEWFSYPCSPEFTTDYSQKPVASSDSLCDWWWLLAPYKCKPSLH
jgi:hypothetical protein